MTTQNIPASIAIARNLELKSSSKFKGNKLPDIASEGKSIELGRLDRVGMSEIEVPVSYITPNGESFRVPARASAFVSLDDPNAKGIHMSRLFLNLQEILGSEAVSMKLLKRLLECFVESHKDISKSSFVDIEFDYMVERKALISNNYGWRTYPIKLAAELINSKFQYKLSTRVLYSSTCPCSAALARQIIQENFKGKFGSAGDVSVAEVLTWLGSEKGVSATPHSQRSYADVEVMFDNENSAVEFLELIDICENALKTPVQAAVKREDEQEFARLNGENLMFCEDASRKLKAALNADARFDDFKIQVHHVESLHPHDAVAYASKDK